MQVCSNFKRLCARLGNLRGRSQRKKQAGRQLTISAPFDFKKETIMLPGFSEDEISALREKAAANRRDVAVAGYEHGHGQDHGHEHGHGHSRPRQPGGSPPPSSSSPASRMIASPAPYYSPRAAPPPPPVPVRALSHSPTAAQATGNSPTPKPYVSPVSPLDASFSAGRSVSPMSVTTQGRPF